MSLNKIIEILKEANSIAILPHVFADGDAIGSCLALESLLSRLGKNVTVFLEEPVPAVYDFLPGAGGIEVFSGKNRNFDVAVSLDNGDYDRLGKRTAIFDNAKTTANVDHHFTNSEFAVHNYIDQKAAATGEIIFDIIKLFNENCDKAMATCLYVAIATDTGGFRFSNTTKRTHQIISELVGLGTNVSEISQKVFDSVSIEKVKLLGQAISSLEVLENGKLAVITLTEAAMKKAGAKDEDCDGIVNTGRNINGVEVAVLLRVRDNGEIKVNFRSKNYVDVATLANLYKGGGHKRAAGCTALGDLEEVKKKIMKDIKEVL